MTIDPLISVGPPQGYKPGQTRAPLILHVTVPLAVVAVFLASLRLYVRAYLVRSFGKDDWLLLAAVMSLCGLISAALWAVSLGLGRHYYDLVQDPEKDPSKIFPVCYSVILLHR